MPRGTKKDQDKQVPITDISTAQSNLENLSTSNAEDITTQQDVNEPEPTSLSKKETTSVSSANNQKKGTAPLDRSTTKANSSATPSDHRSELDSLLDEVRESIKDKSLMDSSSQVLPDSAYQRKKNLPVFIQKIDDWITQSTRERYSGYGARKKTSPAGIFFTTLIIICVILLFFYFLRPFLLPTSTKVPTSTPVPTFVIPQPASLEFPGGWTFVLGASSEVYPDWKPTHAEWLKGTEICKLIAIPWNVQIDAVYKSIMKNDIFKLTMDNKDQYPYIVDSLKMVTKDKLIQSVNSNEPCLIIFLYKESSTNWQVITTKPAIP